jgi:hypothetical protein
MNQWSRFDLLIVVTPAVPPPTVNDVKLQAVERGVERGVARGVGK